MERIRSYYHYGKSNPMGTMFGNESLRMKYEFASGFPGGWAQCSWLYQKIE
jgi:hypothetical protein